VGCEARKFPAAGEVFFLDFPFYRTYQGLTHLCAFGIESSNAFCTAKSSKLAYVNENSASGMHGSNVGPLLFVNTVVPMRAVNKACIYNWNVTSREFKTVNRGQTIGILPSRVRRLAIAGGILSGISGSLLFGPLYLLVPFIQIWAAIVQPDSPQPGRILLAAGAFLNTFDSFGFLAPQAIGAISFSDFFSNYLLLIMFVVIVISLLTQIWLDVEVVINLRHSRNIQLTHKQFIPGIGDWVVWITAGCLSVLFVPMALFCIFVYHRTGRLDILAESSVFGVVSVGLDVALVNAALKIRRASAGT
jgi:hypothetical protein